MGEERRVTLEKVECGRGGERNPNPNPEPQR